MTGPEPPLVADIRGLTIRLDRTGAEVVSDVSLQLQAGQVMALVGESGSGKTTVGSAMLGYCRPGASIVAGEIIVGGQDVARLSGEALRSVRGRVVSYVPQDPATALNPIRRIGSQLRETIRVHRRELDSAALNDEIERVLAEVKLPADRAFLHRFPHQLSGGQQQRLVLAMAFVLRPKAIVLDEPTTGLDVTTQAHVLETVHELCASHGVAALYVTHDLAVVRGIADTVVVLYAGRVVESGPATEVFAEPRHPYTRGLLAAIPDLDTRRVLNPIGGHAPPPGARTKGCSFAPRCDHSDQVCLDALPELRPVGAGRQARCTRLELIPAARPLALQPPVPAQAAADLQALFRVTGVHCAYGAVEVVHDVSFAVGAGRCLALVGESGSGKSTLSKALVGLVPPTKGEIWLRDAMVPATARKRPAQVRRQIQYVFQNPYRSLNPRLTIRQSLSVPVRHFFDVSGEETRRLVDEALDRVALPRRLAAARPRDLSGGERQRAAIARALLCKPTVLICDEVTSSLDVSVQAAIIRLLDELRADDDLAMVFVTHNLAVVRAIADDVVVLCDGQVVEAGPTDAVLDHPAQPYTRSLLADTPRLDLATAEAGPEAVPDPTHRLQMEDNSR